MLLSDIARLVWVVEANQWRILCRTVMLLIDYRARFACSDLTPNELGWTFLRDILFIEVGM